MNPTCHATPCERPVTTRGLCSMHYQRAWKMGSLEPVEVRCIDCGVVLKVVKGGKKRCNDCRLEEGRRRAREYARSLPRKQRVAQVLACYLCGGETPATTRSRRKCRACAQESASTQCGEHDCGRPARARKLCAMHYKRAARSEGRITDVNEWTERRQANHERRRALKLGATVGEPFTNIEIFERDGWKCGLCGKRVDRNLRHPDPLSSSLDHVVPLSVGGAHARENVQLAHLTCNVRKGNRAQGEQLALIG